MSVFGFSCNEESLNIFELVSKMMEVVTSQILKIDYI